MPRATLSCMTAANSGQPPWRPRPRSLAQVLDRQFGVLTLRQAENFGLTMAAVRYRIKPGGRWQRIFPGVYLAVSGTATVDQLDMAALLYAGQSATLTGLAALRRSGVSVPSTRIVDVLVPVSCGRSSHGYLRLHRTARLPRPVAVQRDIQMAMIPRAIVDAARSTAAIREVRAIVAGAVQQGACTVAELERELGRLPGCGQLRAVLAEVKDGVRSSPEGDLMDLIKRADLPTPQYNPRLYVDGEFLASPDAWWAEVSVAAEVDSRQWHFAPEDWERTMLRHDRMAAVGIRVLHFSPNQIRTRPDLVIAKITEAVASGARSPRIRAAPAEA